MMIFYYLGIVILGSAILAVYPLFQDTNWPLGIGLAVLAIIMFYGFIRSSATSGGGAAASGKGKKAPLGPGVGGRIMDTVFLFGVTGVLESVGLWIYIEVFSRLRELNFLVPIFRALFSLCHVQTGVGNGALYVYGIADYPLTFVPNAGNLGAVYLLMFTVGMTALFLISQDRRKMGRSIAWGVFSLAVYLLLRTTAIINLFGAQNVAENNSWHYLTYFWHPIAALLSFLPWALLMALIFNNWNPKFIGLTANWRPKTFRPQLPAALCLGLCVAAAVLLLAWVPSGPVKPGRILFEEYYSDWSKSTRPIDTQWYSGPSTYNFYTLRTYLSSFYQVTVNERPLGGVNLTAYDVILLKIPTKPYPAAVIRKLVAYVQNGGGLWVIGDHTNVFGSSTYMNPLLRNFGVKLNFDALYHNATGRFNQIDTFKLVKHPILQNVPLFLFATPCSMQVSNPALRIAAAGLTTKSYQADYGRDNFFPDTKPDLNIFFGANTALAAGDFGRGRLAVFCDSTPFSNFFVYLPGKTELGLSILSWLNHRPAPVVWKLLLFIGVLGAGVGFIRLFRGIPPDFRTLFWPALFGLLALALVIPVINLLNQKANALPQEIKPLPKAGFVAQYSSIYLPYAEWRDQDVNDFNTFYIWGQRVGLCCRYYLNLNQAIASSRALFIILPKQPFSPEDLAKLDAYLKKGGKIFLLDDGGPGSRANDLLQRYGLNIEYQPSGSGRMTQPGSGIFFDNHLPLGIVTGAGNTLWNWEPTSGKPSPVFVKKSVGAGTLYVFGGVFNFSNRNFGGDRVVPQGNQKIINDLILDLYRMVLN